MELKEVIKEDCKLLETLINDGAMIDNYIYLHETKTSAQSGLYQLIFNGFELHFGTLAEINAIVKALCKLSDADAYDKYNFSIRRAH